MPLLERLAHDSLPHPSPHLRPTCYTQAQAQECIWRKCVVERKANALVAKLARQTSAFYDDAYHTLITRSEVDRSWAAICHAKSALFNAEAFYKQGLVDIEEKEYGTAVARLKAAFNAIQRAAEVGQSVRLDVKVCGGLHELDFCSCPVLAASPRLLNAIFFSTLSSSHKCKPSPRN